MITKNSPSWNITDVLWIFSVVPRLPPGLFSDLSMGILAPSAFPSARSGLRLPPSISHEKDSGLPPVTQKRPIIRPYVCRGNTLLLRAAVRE
jgi:hypothetical protein